MVGISRVLWKKEFLQSQTDSWVTLAAHSSHLRPELKALTPVKIQALISMNGKITEWSFKTARLCPFCYIFGYFFFSNLRRNEYKVHESECKFYKLLFLINSVHLLYYLSYISQWNRPNLCVCTYVYQRIAELPILKRFFFSKPDNIVKYSVCLTLQYKRWPLPSLSLLKHWQKMWTHESILFNHCSSQSGSIPVIPETQYQPSSKIHTRAKNKGLKSSWKHLVVSSIPLPMQFSRS
jgi:hypothetical protein